MDYCDLRHAGNRGNGYWQRAGIVAMPRTVVAATGQPVRALLREKGTPYAELGLGDPKWTDEQLLDFNQGRWRAGRRRWSARGPPLTHPYLEAPVVSIGN